MEHTQDLLLIPREILIKILKDALSINDYFYQEYLRNNISDENEKKKFDQRETNKKERYTYILCELEKMIQKNEIQQFTLKLSI